MGQKKKTIDNDTQADADMMALMSGLFGDPTSYGEDAEFQSSEQFRAVVARVNEYLDTHAVQAVDARAHVIEQGLGDKDTVPATWRTVRAFRALADALDYALTTEGVEDTTKVEDTDSIDSIGEDGIELGGLDA